MNFSIRWVLVAAGMTFAGPIAVTGCGGASDNLPPPPPPPPPPPTTMSAGGPGTPANTPAPTVPVVLMPGAASPDPAAPLPAIKITAPTKGQILPTATAGDFQVKLDVKNWQTAIGSQHVHVILDGKPYLAVYDTKAPIKFSSIPGGDALAEGQHVLVAFPGRGNHESVKTKGALAIVEFYVGKKSPPLTDTSKAMLIYSRPKANYNGDMANHVLVDFNLANATLASGKDHVTIAVTGPGIDKELTASADQFGPPFYLDNLQNGAYTIKLELVGSDGKPLPGLWNSTSREIHVNHDAPNDPPHGTPPADAHAPDGGAAAAPEKK